MMKTIDKDKILKAERSKEVTYKGKSLKLIAQLPKATFEA